MHSRSWDHTKFLIHMWGCVYKLVIHWIGMHISWSWKDANNEQGKYLEDMQFMDMGKDQLYNLSECMQMTCLD